MISKTRFKNLSRCERFAYLEDVHNTSLSDIDMYELMELEKKQKLIELKEQMIDEFSDEETEDLHMETMLPYYNMVESLTANAIKERFGFEVIASEKTHEQKVFSADIDDIKYYCFLDGYFEDDNSIFVFESKATTSKKFYDLGYKVSGEHNSIFMEVNKDKMRLKDELMPEMLEDKKYITNRNKLFDRYNGAGKYVFDLSFQRYVVENSDKVMDSNKKTKYYLAVLSHEYVHKGGKEYPKEAIKFIDLTEITEEYLPIIDKEVKLVNERMITLDDSKPFYGKCCGRKAIDQCTYYSNVCINEPKKNSIFTYINRHHGFKDSDGDKLTIEDLVNTNKMMFDDIPFSYLNRELNQIQYRAMKYDEEHVNLSKIKAGISTLTYPLYHLDFESFPCPIARYKGEKAYSQSLFQYSIHIEEKQGVCDKDKDHYGFLAGDHKDCREDLVRTMCDVIKDDGGSVIVYNQAFEKTRLKELAVIFPEYKERLMDIHDRCFDLLHLVSNNKKMFEALGFKGDALSNVNYYHKNLQGSYSIKKVLPIFSDLTYVGMGVANGQEAMVTYARFPSLNEEEYKQKYDELVEYCKQDTWAMVEILWSLIDMSK